jgi:hypothetical protein
LTTNDSWFCFGILEEFWLYWVWWRSQVKHSNENEALGMMKKDKL